MGIDYIGKDRRKGAPSQCDGIRSEKTKQLKYE